MSVVQPDSATDLCTLLFGGRDADGRPLGHPMQARRHLAKLGLSRAAADFLSLATWWWVQVDRRTFYKFNAPCDHPAYRKDDSWCEELGFSWSTLRDARAEVGTKIKRGISKKEVLASGSLSSLILYWQRPDNRTMYEVNDALLCELLSEMLGTQVVMGIAPWQGSTAHATREQAREGATALVEDPHATARGALPGPAYPHKALLDGDKTQPIWNDRGGPIHKERQPASTPFSSKQQNKEEEGREEGVLLVACALENEGVFAQPALEIARRAISEGLDVTRTLDLFWAHQASAATSPRIKDPLAAATRRLQRGPLQMPRSQQSKAAAAFWREVRAIEEGNRIPLDTDRAQTVIQEGEVALLEQGRTALIASDSFAGKPLSNSQEELAGREIQSLEPAWWKEAKVRLSYQMTQATFQHLLGSSTVCESPDGTLTLYAPPAAAAHLPRWERRLCDAIRLAGGGEPRVVIAERGSGGPWMQAAQEAISDATRRVPVH